MDNAIRGTSVTLIFDEDGLSGWTGCNSYTAAYSATPVDDVTQDIVVDSITSSSQVCTLEVMVRKQATSKAWPRPIATLSTAISLFWKRAAAR